MAVAAVDSDGEEAWASDVSVAVAVAPSPSSAPPPPPPAPPCASLLFRSRSLRSPVESWIGWPGTSSSASSWRRNVSQSSINCLVSYRQLPPKQSPLPDSSSSSSRLDYETYLLLTLHRALQECLDATLEVLHLLPLKPLQLAPHQPAHILKQQP